MILLYKRKERGLTISKGEDSHQKRKKNNNKAINKRGYPPKRLFCYYEWVSSTQRWGKRLY